MKKKDQLLRNARMIPSWGLFYLTCLVGVQVESNCSLAAPLITVAGTKFR